MIGRVLCRLGLHNWRTTRYWALSNQWAEGPECRRCGLLSLVGRRIVSDSASTRKQGSGRA